MNMGQTAARLTTRSQQSGESFGMDHQFKLTMRRILARGTRRGVAVVGECPEVPESHGWLRRSELDQPDAQAWEMPDGRLRLAPPRSRLWRGSER
jgi:hypothetical protein